ncbi:hypothetical protein [Nocardiopsis potens]|uniref:hypothetical protein n=1 Tax=Nocardiopsis potens TaxID=1246458 RepID=UPI00126798EB|nr:hypothetical protein [Nocardiopsis potens]
MKSDESGHIESRCLFSGDVGNIARLEESSDLELSVLEALERFKDYSEGPIGRKIEASNGSKVAESFDLIKEKINPEG